MPSSGDAKTSLRLSRLLRPIRLAFLVPPKSTRAFRLAVELNTCLWGGIQNPIIPVWRRKPEHWGHWKWPGGRAYANGLLEAFEPDFVVETTAGLAGYLRRDPERVVSISDVLNPERDPHIGYGVSMMDLFHHAYDREFKYAWRTRPKALWAHENKQAPTLFEAVVFGAYPRVPKLEYIRKAFGDVFQPDGLSKESVAAFKAQTSGISPLRATTYGLDDRRGGGWRSNELALFLLDPNALTDLIEFWNLRAWGRRCRAVPVGQSPDLYRSVAGVVISEHVPQRGSARKRRSTLLKAPSVPQQALESTVEAFGSFPQDALVLQHWLPRTWDARCRAYDLSERTELVRRSEDLELQVQARNLQFEMVAPDFDVYDGDSGLPVWANTVTLHDYTGIESGLVYPEPGRDLASLLRSTDRTGGPRALREGIAVVSSGGAFSRQYWELPDGQRVVREWFASRKIACSPSAAGRTALEICRSLGGLEGLRFVRSPDLLRRLEDAARGAVITHAELHGLMQRLHGRWASNWTSGLLRHNVLQVGLLVGCPVCETECWYSLSDLSDTLRCKRCLREFAFPGSAPPKKWAYRTQGPFSLSGFANGAYSTLLALRMLGPTFHADMSWFPGVEIGKGEDKYELDFVAFWRKRHGLSAPVRIVMGECKTFDEFTSRDLARFKLVAKQFSDSEPVRVFVTLRTELTAQEKKRLGALAMEGRRLRGTRSPVLVLTAIELLADSPPPSCYGSAGGRFERFKHFHMTRMTGDDGMLGLCDLTQQIHLGMEPYSETLGRELRRSRPRVELAAVSPPSE